MLFFSFLPNYYGCTCIGLETFPAPFQFSFKTQILLHFCVTSLNCLDTDIEILQFRLVNYVSPKTFGDFCLHGNTSDRGFKYIHVKLLNTTPTRKLISKCKQNFKSQPKF